MTRISITDRRALPRGADWRDQAECALPAYSDRRDLWFAKVKDLADVAAAKAVCQVCPVQGACLAAAIREEGGAALDRRFGIRGGATSGERLSLYRRQRATA